jgi:hypothetical protein
MQHTIRVWLIVAFVATVQALRAAPPPNDSFNNRIILTGTNITAAGSNRNASKQNGEPDHAGNIGGASIWWAWTAPTNGDVTINTDGSDFDTLLGVYTGPSVSGLSLVVSNDDHGVLVTGRVRFQALAGLQYQIAVDGFNDGTGATTGSVILNLVFIPEPISRPPNDTFANRIPAVGLPVTLTGTNMLATREPGEPLHADKDGDTSVWWMWTALSNDTVRVSTDGSTFDTLLGVYTGSVVSNLIEVASNDDADQAEGIMTSVVILKVVAGQTYQIAVDGYDGDAGQVVLSIASVVPRLSDSAWLADAGFQFALTGAPGTTNELEASVDLTNWTSVGAVVATNAGAVFLDPAATNYPWRFYRAVLR